MRTALWVTAVMNMGVALVVSPLVNAGPVLLSLPAAEPLYLWIVAQFIFIFGLGYGWCALSGHAPRLFIALAAGGKLAFFITVASFWGIGQLPLKAAAAASADLVFGLLFVCWLYQVRDSVPALARGSTTAAPLR
jgi:hypothetical protein